jgi:hypothetical protein
LTDFITDGYQDYFVEKFWSLIPSHHRTEDATGSHPNVLRALMEVMATQAAALRRSGDRLWEDQFIEWADRWAVPYIADLVGTRLVSAQNSPARRVDVARTIYYRRRKGTLPVLEELIADIARWEGTVVEEFRRLGRAWHRLDPAPELSLGRFTATPAGGLADLRHPRGADLADTPFDEFHHTPDLRRHNGGIRGRYGIPRLGFHLYRLAALEVDKAIPFRKGTGKYTFDPSGRDIQLFMRRNRRHATGESASSTGDWSLWEGAREWELPAPMRCGVLAHGEYEVPDTIVEQVKGELVDEGIGITPAVLDVALDELLTLGGIRFPSARRFKEAIGRLSHKNTLLDDEVFVAVLEASLVAHCGRYMLIDRTSDPSTKSLALYYRGDHGLSKVPEKRIVAGDLENWNVPNARNLWQQKAPSRWYVVDPARGRLLVLPDAEYDVVAVRYHHGSAGNVGAGTYLRTRFLSSDLASTIAGERPDEGTVQPIDEEQLPKSGTSHIVTNGTFTPVSDVVGARSMTVQAADQRRPLLELDTNWVFRGRPRDENGEADESLQRDGALALEGLWVASRNRSSLILRGEFEWVVISHCTIDPGEDDTGPKTLKPVAIEVQGAVETLVIQSSITGPIIMRNPPGGGTRATIEKLIIRDSIVQARGTALAVETMSGALEMSRTTVLGSVNVNHLQASDSIVDGVVRVANRQNACFRFSAAPVSDQHKLPRPYESHFYPDPDLIFSSRRFGDGDFAQVNVRAPYEVRRGAENGREMGAYCGLDWKPAVQQVDPAADQANMRWEELVENYENRVRLVGAPARIDSLKAKVEEYLPIGVIPIYIEEI